MKPNSHHFGIVKQQTTKTNTFMMVLLLFYDMADLCGFKGKGGFERQGWDYFGISGPSNIPKKQLCTTHTHTHTYTHMHTRLSE